MAISVLIFGVNLFNIPTPYFNYFPFTEEDTNDLLKYFIKLIKYLSYLSLLKNLLK